MEEEWRLAKSKKDSHLDRAIEWCHAMLQRSMQQSHRFVGPVEVLGSPLELSDEKSIARVIFTICSKSGDELGSVDHRHSLYNDMYATSRKKSLLLLVYNQSDLIHSALKHPLHDPNLSLVTTCVPHPSNLIMSDSSIDDYLLHSDSPAARWANGARSPEAPTVPCEGISGTHDSRETGYHSTMPRKCSIRYYWTPPGAFGAFLPIYRRTLWRGCWYAVQTSFAHVQ